MSRPETTRRVWGELGDAGALLPVRIDPEQAAAARRVVVDRCPDAGLILEALGLDGRAPIPVVAERFRCAHCPREFGTRSGRWRHERTHMAVTA